MSLEEFVRHHREAFDTRTPSARVWKNIDRALQPAYARWGPAVYWRAAAILLFGVTAFLLGTLWQTDRYGRLSHAREFIELERFYASEIATKSALISTFKNSMEEDNFSQQLQKLEAMYFVLEEEMKRKPTAYVKDALILNMLVRIDLLNQQLEQLEHTRSDSTRRAESAIGV